MSRLGLRAPSPAFVVSLVALIVALGGTSYAAFMLPKNSVGTKQLKNGGVTSTKLRNAAVTGSKIKNGAVTGSKLNFSGVTVPNATHALGADTATHANGADTATNANTLGGQSLASFQPRIRSALVDANGNVIHQTGGITVTKSGTGTYIFGLGEAVSGITVSALGANEFDSTSRIDISADPCGTNPSIGEADCGSQFNDGQHMIVFTADSYASTAGPEDEGFYVDFIA